MTTGFRPLRPRSGGRADAPGPGQPDRRAHRLQRRLRAAARDPAADAGGARRRAPSRCVRVWSASVQRAEILEYRSAARSPATAGSTTSRGSPRCCGRRGTSSADSICGSSPTCRWAAGCRRARRWRCRCCARCGEAFGLELDDVELALARPEGRERFRGRAGRRHGPDGVEPGRREDARCSSTPGACSTRRCRCRRRPSWW